MVDEPSLLRDDPTVRDRLSDGPLYVMSDFDGTLSAIVEEPEDAAIRDDARRALAALADAPRTEVALVSGRELTDLRMRADLAGVAYAGNHGLEIETADGRFVHPEARAASDDVAAVLGSVRDAVEAADGLRLEDKGLTATVHYRTVEDPAVVDRIEAAVRAAADERPAIEVGEGKASLELRPAVEWDKGSAVQWLRSEFLDGGAPVLYAGDDTTDEDAHRAIGEDGVTIRVGDGETAASHRVADPDAVAELLAWLADARSPRQSA